MQLTSINLRTINRSVAASIRLKLPAPLGNGCWAFVENAAALPWRS